MNKETRKKTLTGVVTGTKMKKTVTVTITRLVQHPIYKKTIKKRSKFLVHDEYERCKVGGKVRIIETRPLSKRKRWRILEIISIGSKENKTTPSDKGKGE